MRRIVQSTLSASSLLVLACGMAHATDVFVPGQFPTIQAAINAAEPDSRILISPGVYTESLIFNQRVGLTLVGTGPTPASVTLTTAGGSIAFINDSQNIGFENLTITGGVATPVNTTCGGPLVAAGGGIVSLESELVLQGVVFSNNRAAVGGALYSVNSLVTIRNSTFTANSATVNAAAIFATNCNSFSPRPLVIESTSFASNTQPAGQGVVVLPGGEVFIRRSTFTSNIGEDLVMSSARIDLIVDDTTFSGGQGSTASLNFAAMSPSSNLTLSRTRIDNSDAVVINNAQSRTELTDVTITRSTQTNSLSVQNSQQALLRIDRLTSTGGVGAGGFISTNDSEVLVSNSIFAGNAGDGLSFTTAAAAAPGLVTLGNLTLANNGGVGLRLGAFPSGEGRISNSIVTGNVLGQIQPSASPGSPFVVTRSIVTGGYAGGNQSNVLTGAPTFVDAAAGDYDLAPNSLGIDAGDNNLIVSGTIDFDARRRPRLVDIPTVVDTGPDSPPLVDLGALERQIGPAGPTCNYDFNQDENVDLNDAQLMAAVAAGIIIAQPNWLSGDLNEDGNADLTDAQILARFVATGVCSL